MYQAKEKGRNNFQFYTAEMNRQVSERLKLRRACRRRWSATSSRSITSPGSTSEAVALVLRGPASRQHPERGLLLPSALIALAEETGLLSCRSASGC